MVLGLSLDAVAFMARTCVAYVLKLLEECVERDSMCRLLLEELKSFMRENSILVAPFLVCDEEGEPLAAAYWEGEEGRALLLSLQSILDPGYAASSLLHELAHSLGLEEEDYAEAVALMYADVEEEPPYVARARRLLEEAGCSVRLGEGFPLLRLLWP